MFIVLMYNYFFVILQISIEIKKLYIMNEHEKTGL